MWNFEGRYENLLNFRRAAKKVGIPKTRSTPFRGLNNSLKGRTGFGIFRDFQGFLGII